MKTPAAFDPRFERVLDHIDAHLDEPLDTARLSEVAACSRHHFVRRFAARFGLGVQAYLQRRRLRRAAWQLAFRPGLRITEIALAAGYDSTDAFARAFRRRTGQSPTGFRARPDAGWEARFALPPRPQPAPGEVHVVVRAPVPVARLRHQGDPAALDDTLRRFIAWRRAHGLPPSRSATYNVLHDDPAQTEPGAFRLDVCAAFAGEIAENDMGVVADLIPGGRYARLRHVGTEAALGECLRDLYARWLPASGEVARDAPPVLQRRRLFPDVPAHAAETDILLPLRCPNRDGGD
ncbi:AraC family transcriptional regulator [Luteimonas sp. Y-2-2-4F]|nr:AraC family transcriptional regulator [Luteimonas sp. Y-2-2-4F]MCD9031881.1 AraC family transcriptional regulator [Luteimonas sp. Y-2-2-4F]